jgi:hypothetical protein
MSSLGHGDVLNSGLSDHDFTVDFRVLDFSISRSDFEPENLEIQLVSQNPTTQFHHKNKGDIPFPPLNSRDAQIIG